MKKQFYQFGLAILIIASSITGCQKTNLENVETPAPPVLTETSTSSIAKIIQNENLEITPTEAEDVEEAENILQRGGKKISFSLLAYSLVKTGLISAFADTSLRFTLFAPTDNAFRNAGIGTFNDINNTPDSVLKPILLYHVLGAKVLAAQVPAGPNAPVTTLNGKKIFATRKTDGKVFVNGIKVIFKDLQALNGVIHVIDRLLLPPSKNIVEAAIANPNFSYLVAAVVRASSGSTNVAAALSGAGPLTVFAPTNQAFINAGFPTIASINAAPPAALTSILVYHVIGARVFSSDLSQGLTPTMLGGGTTRITLNGGPRIKGNGNNVASKIITIDIVTTNGVIHVIDRVLLP